MIRRIVLFLGSCSLLLGAQTAAAQLCGSESPNLTALEDEYYAIDVDNTPSAAEKKQINAAFKRFEGKWTGTGQRISCKGSAKDPRQVDNQFLIEANIQHSDNTLEVRATLEDEAANKVSNDKILVRLGKTPFQLTRVDENALEFVEKWRIRNQNNRSLMMEKIYSIERTGRRLVVTVSLYVNGAFGSQDTWELGKKR